MSVAAMPQPYVFDQNQTDHSRLVRQARLIEGLARETCLRAGLRRGDRAIDVGCGPVGTLPILAELVGVEGRVVGIDINTSALAHARQELDSQGLQAVELVEANINTISPGHLTPVPFDLAMCRLLLMYQVDPVDTLRRVAALVRPGGRIVALDILHDPRYPWFDPPLPAAEQILRLFFALVQQKGGTVDVAQRYRQICDAAGLRLVSQQGWMAVAQDPRDYVALFRDILLSMRGSLIQQQIGTGDEIAALVEEMDAALPGVRFGTMTVCVEMIAEVP